MDNTDAKTKSNSAISIEVKSRKAGDGAHYIVDTELTTFDAFKKGASYEYHQRTLAHKDCTCVAKLTFDGKEILEWPSKEEEYPKKKMLLLLADYECDKAS